MDLIRQYLASPEFAEAIGNVVVIAIMATAAGIDWKIYGRKTRRRTPPSIDTPQRRRRAAQRRTIPAGHIDESQQRPPAHAGGQANPCKERTTIMDTIKTLVIEPLRRPELRDIDPSITAIGKTIGGYAEPLPLDRRTTLWCDEEGAIKNLKPNRTIRLSQDSRLADAGKPIIIRGTFVITGPHPQDGPLGLDDEQIGRYAAMFADPEAPCRLPDGKTFMIPVHPIG